jgi:hypothetical protein
MKLGSNKALERNLKKQAEIYQSASDASKAIKVILVLSEGDSRRVAAILKRLKLTASPDVVVIDGRMDHPRND